MNRVTRFTWSNSSKSCGCKENVLTASVWIVSGSLCNWYWIIVTNEPTLLRDSQRQRFNSAISQLKIPIEWIRLNLSIRWEAFLVCSYLDYIWCGNRKLSECPIFSSLNAITTSFYIKPTQSVDPKLCYVFRAIECHSFVEMTPELRDLTSKWRGIGNLDL